MVIRRPPDDYIPRVARSGRSKTPRVVRYEEPKAPFFRSLLRALFKPYIILSTIVLAAFAVGFLVYYWVIFSARIDNLLKGEVFTRSAGIYAAPKQLRVGENISEEEVIAYLKRAGYVEKGQQADIARGRYGASGNTVDVEPSQETTVDGQHQY